MVLARAVKAGVYRAIRAARYAGLGLLGLAIVTATGCGRNVAFELTFESCAGENSNHIEASMLPGDNSSLDIETPVSWWHPFTKARHAIIFEEEGLPTVESADSNGNVTQTGPTDNPQRFYLDNTEVVVTGKPSDNRGTDAKIDIACGEGDDPVITYNQPGDFEYQASLTSESEVKIKETPTSAETDVTVPILGKAQIESGSLKYVGKNISIANGKDADTIIQVEVVDTNGNSTDVRISTGPVSS